jgi:hypothetical protein
MKSIILAILISFQFDQAYSSLFSYKNEEFQHILGHILKYLP